MTFPRHGKGGRSVTGTELSNDYSICNRSVGLEVRHLAYTEEMVGALPARNLRSDTNTVSDTGDGSRRAS